MQFGETLGVVSVAVGSSLARLMDEVIRIAEFVLADGAIDRASSIRNVY
jgi:hypothetical protein